MGNKKTTEAVGLAPDPLSLYSAERWARLEAKGYESPAIPSGPQVENVPECYPLTKLVLAYNGQMNSEGEIPVGVKMGYARRVIRSFVVDGKLRHEYHFAVPIPGDPGYKGVINELSHVS